MNNPFETINARLSNIETLLLDLKHKPKETGNQAGRKKTVSKIAAEADQYVGKKKGVAMRNTVTPNQHKGLDKGNTRLNQLQTIFEYLLKYLATACMDNLVEKLLEFFKE